VKFIFSPNRKPSIVHVTAAMFVLWKVQYISHDSMETKRAKWACSERVFKRILTASRKTISVGYFGWVLKQISLEKKLELECLFLWTERFLGLICFTSVVLNIWHIWQPSRLPSCFYRSRPVNYIICGNHINFVSYVFFPSRAFLMASLLLTEVCLNVNFLWFLLVLAYM